MSPNITICTLEKKKPIAFASKTSEKVYLHQKIRVLEFFFYSLPYRTQKAIEIILQKKSFFPHCPSDFQQSLSVSRSSFVEISSIHCLSQFVRARELKFLENVYHPVCVMCHMSRVICHMSHVMCHFFY